MVVELEDKPSELIARFVYLRDAKKKAEETYAEWRKAEFDQPMNEIEMKLLDMMNRLGTDSMKTKQGTAYKKMATSVTTRDGAAFRTWIIGNELWDVVDWRPNKPAINDLISAGEPLPPGLNRTTFYNVNVNRPEEKNV